MAGSQEHMDTLMNLPPVQWQAYVDGLTDVERMEVESKLLGLVERSTQLAQYVGGRRTFNGLPTAHAKAVKSMNAQYKAVRRVFGYYDTPDLRI